MDGTLLNSSQEISNKNLKAINDFKNKGGKFTIATGRMLKSALPYIEQLNVNIPVILLNGAAIYDPIKKAYMDYQPLSIAQTMLDLITKTFLHDDIAILCYTLDDVYALKDNDILQTYEKKDRVKAKIMDLNRLEDNIIKILLISNNKKELVDFQETIEEKYDCETVFSEADYLEILPKNTSKGNALKKLTYHFPNKKLRKVCIGDNLNDISMLSYADEGYFVENSHVLLKKKPFIGCVRNDDHALADIITNRLT